jgi:serine/threonine protein phosphatase PrpC
MRLASFGLSDVGQRRALNEDSFLSDDALGFFVVADGVGGRAKGEIASAMGVEEAYGYVKKERGAIQEFQKHSDEARRFAVHRMVESAVQYACYMVYGLAEQDPNRFGMSTTMSALLVVERFGFVAQVGDSRIYQLRAGQTRRLTEDHTLINFKLKQGLITAEEAERSPGKNVITRAVGHRDYVQVDTTECNVQPRDRFLLCSDGLHSCIEEAEIADLMPSGPLEEVARRYVDLANSRGGRDNITVLLVDILP